MSTNVSQKKEGFGGVIYWIAVAVVIAALLVIAFTALFREEMSSFFQSLLALSNPLAFMEQASFPITYIVWGAMVVGVVFLVFIRLRSENWYSFMKTLAEWGLIEKGDAHDVKAGLRIGAEMAGLAAFCWIVLSPIPIIPGAVHWRTFAFIPGLAALLFGRGVGMLSGYLGTIIWALLAGYWILPHTPVVDGMFVGALTGWFIAVALRGKMSREGLLRYIEGNRLRWIVSCVVVNLIGGVVMGFFVGASLNVTTAGAVPWWAGFFAIGVISDTLPMMIFTAFLTESLLRLTVRHRELPNF